MVSVLINNFYVCMPACGKNQLHNIHVCRYFVFADPKGPKIGNGGATLHVLEQLEQKISEDELNKGILRKLVYIKTKCYVAVKVIPLSMVNW